MSVNRKEPIFGDKRVLIIGHATEIYGPVQALLGYSKRNMGKLSSILHPLPCAIISHSELNTYVRGTLIKKRLIKNAKLTDILSYIQHPFFTLLFLLKNKDKFDLCVGIDNLNAFFGIALRKLGVVNSVAFYVIDYTPKRFDNSILNSLYHSLDRFCCKHCDYIWNLSERMVKIRQMQGVAAEKNLVVPVGIELEKIPPVTDKKRNHNMLAFVSHLSKSKGIELVIAAMPDILKRVPNARMEIIGSGPYEPELRALTNKLGLNDCVNFVGLMQHDDLMKYLPSLGIALATYTDDPNNITYYADPTKPKEYLACGLPVVITNVPWIARIIKEKPMGIAINYNCSELVDAVVLLLTDSVFYEKCRQNALAFSSGLGWDTIYDKAFYATFDHN